MFIIPWNGMVAVTLYFFLMIRRSDFLFQVVGDADSSLPKLLDELGL